MRNETPLARAERARREANAARMRGALHQDAEGALWVAVGTDDGGVWVRPRNGGRVKARTLDMVYLGINDAWPFVVPPEPDLGQPDWILSFPGRGKALFDEVRWRPGESVSGLEWPVMRYYPGG